MKTQYRGPSAIDRASTLEEETPSRAVANQKMEEERGVRAVAEEEERNIDEVDTEERLVRQIRSGQSVVTTTEQPQTGRISMPSPRYASVGLYKTECDLELAPKDRTLLRAHSGSYAWLSIVGTGKPKVVPLKPAMIAKMGTCELEVYKTHEDVHVKNAAPHCAAFKKCVESHYSWYSSTLYYDQYIQCHNTNHGGLHPNCR